MKPTQVFLFTVTVFLFTENVLGLPERKDNTRQSDCDYMEKIIRLELKMEMLEEEFEEYKETTDTKFSELDDENKKLIARLDQNLEQTLKLTNQTATQVLSKLGLGGMISLPDADMFGKKDVVFQVNNIWPQPDSFSIIKFKKIITDTNNAFDVDTGYFTVPIKGTYWFAAQVCTIPGKGISPAIVVNNEVMNRVNIKDSDVPTCGMVTAVALLDVGDKVCVKAGRNDYAVYSNKEYNVNTFMGSLV